MARHHCDILEEAVLPAGAVTPYNANALHASALYGEYNERFDVALKSDTRRCILP